MGANSNTPMRITENRVIVTRPVRECQHWVEQLQRLGFAAEALPLIEIGPAADPPDLQALQNVLFADECAGRTR